MKIINLGSKERTIKELEYETFLSYIQEDKVFNAGDVVEFIIKEDGNISVPIKGVLMHYNSPPNGRAFTLFHSNSRFSGSIGDFSRPSRYDYTCGYYFGEIDDYVTILKKIGEVKVLEPIPTIVDIKKSFEKINFEYKDSHLCCSNDLGRLVSFFIERYPSCCGSTIIHNFAIQSTIPYKIIEDVKKFFRTLTTNIDCIVQDKEIAQNNFLLELGFTKVDSFINKNTDRLLHKYSLNQQL